MPGAARQIERVAPGYRRKMNPYRGRVRVPIRVIQQETNRPRPTAVVENAPPPVVECPPAGQPASNNIPAAGEEGDELATWRERALRLEAEMDNFRKRQQQMAQITIAEERERLLRGLLQVADDLDRAIAAGNAAPEKLIEGLSLTRQTMTRLLTSEGVEHVPADGEPFDPNWHEAVGSRPHQETGKAAGEIVQVVTPGYRLGERLLRPARVIVAV